MTTGPHQYQISEILPDRIFLGDIYHSRSKAHLQALNIKKIVNAADDLPCCFPDDFQYLHLQLDDIDEEDAYKYFDTVYDFIESSPEPVFLHCRMGRSRSGTLVISYVGRKMNMNFYDALKFVQQRRYCVLPNDGFQEQLQRYLG